MQARQIETDQNIKLDVLADEYRIILRVHGKTFDKYVILKPTQAKDLAAGLSVLANKMLGEIISIVGDIEGRKI